MHRRLSLRRMRRYKAVMSWKILKATCYSYWVFIYHPRLGLQTCNNQLLPMCGLLIPKWADTQSSPQFLEIAPNLWDWCIEQTNKIMFETQALVPGEPIKLNCMVPLLDWCCINVSNCPGNGGLWQYYGITNYLEKASRGKETQRLKNLNSCR